MNKKELIATMAEKTGMTQVDAGNALKAFTETVVEALQKGDKVQLIGFGTFEVAEREARTVRNPRTNEQIEVPASRIPKFKAGKAMKDIVNQ